MYRLIHPKYVPRCERLVKYMNQSYDRYSIKFPLAQLTSDMQGYMQLLVDLGIDTVPPDDLTKYLAQRQYLITLYGEVTNLSVMIVEYVAEAEEDYVVQTLHYKTKAFFDPNASMVTAHDVIDPETKQTETFEDYLAEL